jgi:hypothetical protein
VTSFLGTPHRVVISAPDSQIVFDATVTETHTDKLTMTQHPVETGADVTDHARKEPEEITISGIISNQPIVLNIEENLKPSVPGGDPNNRAQEAYNEFRRLQESVALLEVDTEIRDYTDMVITSISVARDASKRFILDIGLTLRQFRKATTRSVPAPEPIEPTHKPEGKGGNKNKKTPPTEVEEKANSVLEDAANALDLIRGGA